MSLRTQTAVMNNLDRMAGRRIAAMQDRYRAKTLAPLVDVLEGAKSAAEALARLDGALLERMDVEPLADTLADNEVQTALIGRASALKKSKAQVG